MTDFIESNFFNYIHNKNLNGFFFTKLKINVNFLINFFYHLLNPF